MRLVVTEAWLLGEPSDFLERRTYQSIGHVVGVVIDRHPDGGLAGLPNFTLRSKLLHAMPFPGLPPWLTSWIAVGAFLIAVAGFALRWIEFRQGRQRKVAVNLIETFIEENEAGDGDAVYIVEVVNTGAVPVRVHWWYLSNGRHRVVARTNKLTGSVIAPGDHAEGLIDYVHVMGELGGEREIRAYVRLVGERRYRTSNWNSPSSHAEPITTARRLRLRIATFVKSRRAVIRRSTRS